MDTMTNLSSQSNFSETFQPLRVPVSIKGVVVSDGKVMLLKNERDEWELAGGKIECGEQPRACVVREILEETTLSVIAREPVHAWMYHIREGVDVFVLVYACDPLVGAVGTVSHEHKELRWFGRDELTDLNIPRDYLVAIWKALGIHFED
jgi:8-oxo-dGTP pyrophosphatase MutT (NUDIX family)